MTLATPDTRSTFSASPCPVCHSTEAEPFREDGTMRLVRCPNCRLVRLDPPPSRENLDAFYDDAYAGGTLGYFTKVDRKLARSAGRVRQICALLGKSPHGLSFLDVGANGGFMSEAAHRAGFQVTGVEPDAGALRYAEAHFPGIRFIHGFVENAALEPGSFDVVYCSEVIEHSADCNAFVSAIARAMKPKALLYLTTPDIGHWRRPKDIAKWDAFTPPVHCLYFTPSNLQMLLANHGLTIVRKRFALKPGIKLFARKSG